MNPSLVTKEQASGCVVNISSIGGVAGMGTAHAYSAAKSGVNNLTRSMAVSYGRFGIRANAIAAGTVDTKMVRGYFKAT